MSLRNKTKSHQPTTFKEKILHNSPSSWVSWRIFDWKRNGANSTMGYRNSFDWFQKFLTVDIQSIQNWQQINIFFLRLWIVAIFCNSHKITVIPLFYGSVTLQRMGHFEPDNTVPKEKTLNPASFSNVAISFIGSPFLALSYHNLAWNAAKILPIRILPRASTNPAPAISACSPHKDTARQASKPCRACPYSLSTASQ